MGVCRGVSYGLMVSALAFSAGRPAADTITVDGTTYKGVYIRETSSAYCIHVPSDGTIVFAAKDKVDKNSVRITSNEHKRKALYAEWKENYAQRPDRIRKQSSSGPSEDNAILIADPKKPLEKTHKGFEVFERKKQGYVLTNRGDKYRSGKAAKPVFISRNDVPVFTNKTGKYRGNREYVEVFVQFDRVVVPKRYRNLTPDKYTMDEYAKIVRENARRYGLDPDLIFAVIKVESDFAWSAVSNAGARGLMQLMPGTAAEMGVTGAGIFDPASNIAAGTQYLAKLMDLFDGNLAHALAGYNAGPGNVIKYKGIPPFKETRNYVREVQRYHGLFKRKGLTQQYASAGKTVGVDYLPETDEKYVTVQYRNGLTQRAEDIVEGETHYYAEFKGAISAIPKSEVLRIIQPE